jgi:hypothetical protein
MEAVMKKKVLGSKLWVLGGLIFLPFLQTGCFAQMGVSAKIPPAAQLQTDEKYTWDFGKVKEGEVLVHKFSLKNESSKVMQITSVNTTCGCTTSYVKQNSLKPQESTDIEVKFNTKGYSGSTLKFIYVNTDDIDNPVIRFIIKAEVIKEKNTEVK